MSAISLNELPKALRRFLTPPRDPGRTGAPTPGQGLAPVMLGLVTALMLYLLVKQGTEYVAFNAAQAVFAWAAVIGVATLAFAWVRYDGMPRFGRAFLRASAVFLVVYTTVQPFDIPYVMLPLDHPAVQYHQNARPVALTLAALGLWRPGFVFGSAMLVWMIRDLHQPLTGYYFSDLDIRNVLEVIVLGSAGSVAIAAARQVQSLRDLLRLDEAAESRAVILILAAGFGGHLGNYFYSALAKLALDGPPFNWLYNNDLQALVLSGIEKGVFPFTFSPLITEAIFVTVGVLAIPFCVGSFVVQGSALLAPLKRGWMIAVTLVLDLFHLLVYLTAGLLFWKWMALNTIIVATMAVMTDAEWNKLARRTCVLFVLISPVFFKTATLAWYDTTAFVSVYFEAETKDGERYRIPNAYFGTASYQVSQAQLFIPRSKKHFTHGIGGSTMGYDDVLAAQRCEVPERDSAVGPYNGPRSRLTEYVRARHRQMLERIDEDGIYNYYLQAHHHVPHPFVHDPVYVTDKRDIAKYYYIVESVCLDWKNRAFQRQVIGRSAYEIYDTRTDSGPVREVTGSR